MNCFLVKNSDRIIGVYTDLRIVEEEVSLLASQGLIPVENIQVFRFRRNMMSIGELCNINLKLPLGNHSSRQNVCKQSSCSSVSNNKVNVNNNFNENKTTLITDNDMVESSSENETSDDNFSEYEGDSEHENSQENENNIEEVEETLEEKEKRERKEKRRNERESKMRYNLQLLKKKKEKLEEEKRIYNIDLDLYNKFRKIKQENSNFEIPPMFIKKYETMLILEQENELNFNNFTNVYEQDVTNTKWSKLFSGPAQERELLEISDSEDEEDEENTCAENCQVVCTDECRTNCETNGETNSGNNSD